MIGAAAANLQNAIDGFPLVVSGHAVCFILGFEQQARPNLKHLLLAGGPRVEDLVPPRRRWRHREPPALD